MPMEKRKGLAAIPQPIGFFLNAKQIRAIDILERFGWSLVCVRREGCHDLMPVLWNHREKRPGVLEADGVLSTRSNIRLRVKQKETGL